MARKRSTDSVAAEPTSSSEPREAGQSRAGRAEPRRSAGKQAGRAERRTSASGPPGKNGAATAQGASAASDRVERAEQMIDQFAERVGHYTSVVGRQLLRLGMRAREEAEDMWAEAQSIRDRRRHGRD